MASGHEGADRLVGGDFLCLSVQGTRAGWFYCKLLCLAYLDMISILIHKPSNLYF